MGTRASLWLGVVWLRTPEGVPLRMIKNVVYNQGEPAGAVRLLCNAESLYCRLLQLPWLPLQ